MKILVAEPLAKQGLEILRAHHEVDVVYADACPADDDQARGVGHDLGRHLDLAADQQGVVLADDRG